MREYNNKFTTFMNTVAGVVLLSLLYIVTCIPIITIGSATSAMYYTMVKVVRKDCGYLTREYMKVFKRRFFDGMLLTILYIVLGVVLYLDRTYTSEMNTIIGLGMFYIINVVGIVYLGALVYTFPVFSRFNLTKKETLKMAVFLVIRHLPYSFLLMLILGVTVFVLWLFPLPCSIFLPGCCCYLISIFMEQIMKQYMRKPKSIIENEEETEDIKTVNGKHMIIEEKKEKKKPEQVVIEEGIFAVRELYMEDDEEWYWR